MATDNVNYTLSQRFRQQESDAGRSLNFSDGGGTSGGMEARINKLEEHVGTLRVDVGIIKTELTHKPTKGFIVGSTMGGVGLLTALLILLQHLGVLH